MNQPRDRHFKRLAAIFFIVLSATAASFGATNTAVLTVQVTPAGRGTVSPNYNGEQLVIGKTYRMTAREKSGFTFTGWTGSQTSSRPKLAFIMTPGLTFTANFADEQKPTLAVATPPGSKALTSDTVVIVGSARDNAAVTNVSYSLNGTGWLTASTGNGWSNWWATVTLSANTNTLQAYAVDASGNQSKIAKVNMTLVAGPVSLDGLTMAATPDGINTNTKSFNASTFSEDTAVGAYTFIKASAATAKLSLKYVAPPTAAHASNDVTLLLRFTDSTNGSFIDDDGTIKFTNTFTLAPAEDWAPPTFAGSTVILLSDGGNETDLSFPQESAIVDNGHMFNVSNPLAISLSTPYAGEIGDRVSVAFIQLKNFSGRFIPVGTPAFAGTVIDFDTNTVTILFDKSTFVSRTELFAPVSGTLVNILTFDYTNSDTTTGTGTSTFTNYSPVGSLLQLNQAGENKFLVLTFTNDSDSGNYYEESFNTSSNTPNVDSGSFSLTLPPQITAQPADVTATNGGLASFSITAVGSPTLTYRWQMNTNDLTDGDTVSGSTISNSATANLMLFNVSTNDAGSYQVIVTNNFGSVTSRVATLTISTNTQ